MIAEARTLIAALVVIPSYIQHSKPRRTLLPSGSEAIVRSRPARPKISSPAAKARVYKTAGSRQSRGP